MDVLSLVARLTLDSSEYDKGLDDASGKASGFGAKIGSGLATAAKIGGAAISAAAAGVGALVKSSVENYAEYEQLVGGVETLFKTSADVVQEYAANAYKTAGLSANDYMETVTSFSASLLQSLGGDTAAAADYADMAITDMSDNANKMGTSMEAIQNAYQGFAKQNYTMLDNLKLGYGGTKEEMQRLLDDASALSGIEYDISSYADIVDAIHVVQTEMGITGTTTLEASETISGSLASMKSAWANLVTGIADENANFDELVNNFVDSVLTVGDNILPRVEQALAGVGRLVEGLAPVITNALPGLIENVLPPLLQSATSLIGSIGQALIDNLPLLLSVGLDLIMMLATGIADSLPELVPSIVDVVLQIVETLTDPGTLTALVDAALAITLALATGLIDAIPRLIEAVPVIITNLVTALIQSIPQIIQAALQLMVALGKGIIQGMGSIAQAMRQITQNINQAISSLISSAISWGRDLIQSFINGIVSRFQSLRNTLSSFAGTVRSFLGFSEPEEGPLSNFHTYAPDMMKLFAEGIRDNEHLVTDQLARSFDFGTRLMPGMSGGYAGQAFSVPVVQEARDMTIILTLDGNEFGRAVYKYGNQETQRVGVRLAGGIA